MSEEHNKWGDTVPIRVKIPADLSHTGKERWAVKQIDRAVADIVKALQEAGIDMRSSCAGHWKPLPKYKEQVDGEIVLQDGRVLRVEYPALWGTEEEP